MCSPQVRSIPLSKSLRPTTCCLAGDQTPSGVPAAFADTASTAWSGSAPSVREVRRGLRRRVPEAHERQGVKQGGRRLEFPDPRTVNTDHESSTPPHLGRMPIPDRVSPVRGWSGALMEQAHRWTVSLYHIEMGLSTASPFMAHRKKKRKARMKPSASRQGRCR